MTYKQAVSEFQLSYCPECPTATENNSCYRNECEVYLAIEALEKQTPKKPINCDDNGTGYRCYCGETLLGNWKPKYCMFCGQALDWSE